MEDFSFGRELRLLTPSHYSRIFNEPARAATPYFTLLAKPNDQEKPRLGLTVAKKRVKKACQRNRIKRLARESFRLNQHNIDKQSFMWAKGDPRAVGGWPGVRQAATGGAGIQWAVSSN